MTRDFIIQRYSMSMWPEVTGLVPFFCTGPSFMSFVVPGSLDRYREYRFNGEFRDIISSIGDDVSTLNRESIAEFLLSESIVRALWAETPLTPTLEMRWNASVISLAGALTEEPPMVAAVLELLSGLGSQEHFHSYVAEDAIVLTPLALGRS